MIIIGGIKRNLNENLVVKIRIGEDQFTGTGENELDAIKDASSQVNLIDPRPVATLSRTQIVEIVQERERRQENKVALDRLSTTIPYHNKLEGTENSNESFRPRAGS